MTNEELIGKLPEPKTAEEQYLYEIACGLAGVENTKPLHDAPFTRKERYLRAIGLLIRGAGV